MAEVRRIAEENDLRWEEEGVPLDLRDLRYARDHPKLRPTTGARRALQELREKHLKEFLGKLAAAEAAWLEVCRKRDAPPVEVREEGLEDGGTERLDGVLEEILTKWREGVR